MGFSKGTPILAGSAAAVSAQTEELAPKQEIIYLKASDGVTIPAVLMTPAAGLNPHTPGIVLHHGGPGGHPVRSVGAPRWALNTLPRGATRP